MDPPVRASGLQIEEDLRHQRSEWLAERAAWGLIALVILAAVAGLFGGGGVSHVVARTDWGSIEYERFARRGAPVTLIVRVAAGAAVDPGSRSPPRPTTRHLRLRIARHYLSRVDIDSVTPTPDRALLGGDWLTFTFLTVSPGPFEIAVDVKPTTIGVSRGRLAIGDDRALEYWQLVYP